MFYRTQIKSVTDYGAVDMAGKKLRFVGYLPVKAGDWVFTDGTYIFGNVPPRGSPATFGEDPPGVPVLGDFDSSGENELRGYFSRNGNFKNYPVKQDTWLVNSDKKFAHGSEDNVIDVELADDGSLLTVEKNPVQILDNDYDYHEGFYQQTPSGMYGALSLIRIAVLCEGDRSIFYNHPVVGFQDRGYPYAEHYGMNKYYRHAPFYYLGGSANNSYKDGFYSAFENDSTGFGIRLRMCRFLLTGQDLDYRNFDGDLVKQCELIFRQDGKEIQRVDIADLLKTFEQTAQDEVSFFPSLLPNRESVKHLKSRAVIRNFKIKAADDWELLLEAEIWASNTFYNNAEEHVSHDPLILDTNPFHISSTVSHRHLLINFKADGTFEEIFKWHFLYPLQLRDSTFGEYYFGEREVSVVEEGAWIVRTITGITAGIVDGKQRYYSEIWRDYDSRREAQPLNYDEPTFEVYDFDFPVQDNYRAKIINCDAENAEEIDIDKWQFDGIIDADNKEIIGAFLPDETDAHTWNIGCASLKGGSYLFGTHDKALYKIDRDGNSELVGDKLKNFRLRELKKISKSRR